MARQRAAWILVTTLACAVACTSPAGDATADARFVVLGAAVVRDTRTGLEWTRHDDGAGLDWFNADAYCRALSIDHGARWRLPNIEELWSLYGKPTRSPCGAATCAIDPAFTLTSPYVWSASGQGTVARTYVDFQFGTQLTPTITPHLLRGALCVRSSANLGRRDDRQPAGWTSVPSAG
jgi:hypothetical protein